MAKKAHRVAVLGKKAWYLLYTPRIFVAFTISISSILCSIHHFRLVMFFKITKGKCQDYLYLVEGYRDKNNKVKHRKICSLGSVNKLDPAFVKSFAQITKYNSNLEFIDLAHTTIVERINYGGTEIVNYFWQHFGLNSLIKKLKGKTKLQIDVESILKLLLASRLIKPESKLQIHNHQKYYGASYDIALHKLYRTLDFLSDHHEEIQKHLYNSQIEKERMKVNVVFYDVTTFYFESVKQDDLKDFGFSKDCKVNQTQVMFSILVNHEGRPIKCDIHKGNSYEGHTLVQALSAIKEEYKIKQVILVADRGINNGENLLEIKKAGFDYIVGSRIKNAGAAIKKEIIDLAGYEPIMRDADQNINLAYKVIDREKKVKQKEETHIINGRLVCTWSATRATKDKVDRERLVERAKDMLNNGSYLSSRGARKYIDATIENNPQLKIDKILIDAQWDGFYGIETSNMDLPAAEIAAAYHQLWVVEESFRILKHHFETRPMFHWTPNRIIGHLTLSYISLLFERSLELKLKSQGIEDVTHDRIREALTSMEISIINNNDKKLHICSEHDKLAATILLTFNLSKPMNRKI